MITALRRAFGPALALAIAGCVAAPAARVAPGAELVAFYVPWEPPALASLKAHVSQLDVFAPMWASLVSARGEVRWETDPEAHAALAAAARKPKVMPVVSDAHDDIWDVAAAEAVITDPAAGQAFAENLAQRAKAEGLAGYVMDFENLTPKGEAGYPDLIARVRDRLHADGRELWVTALVSVEPAMQRQLMAASDAVVLMAYDQCWATSTPGPIASDAWLAANLKAKLAGEDARRYVVALASYGYDWPQGQKAEVVAADAARGLAAKTGQTIASQPEPHFGYQAASAAHQVWFQDGQAFARQRAMVEASGARGVALWRMGLEDPALWTARAEAPTVPRGPTETCAPLGLH